MILVQKLVHVLTQKKNMKNYSEYLRGFKGTIIGSFIVVLGCAMLWFEKIEPSELTYVAPFIIPILIPSKKNEKDS